MNAIKLFTTLSLALLLQACTFAGNKDGDYYYALAHEQELENLYTKAFKSFSKAASLYLKEGQAEKLVSAKEGMYRTKSVLSEYSLSLSKFKAKAKKHYPWATSSEIDGWLGSMQLLTMDIDGGKTMYYHSEIENLAYRNQAIMDANMRYKGNPLKKFMDFMLDGFVKIDYTDFNLPYDRPKDILADLQFIIKKSKIPKNGDGKVRVWLPSPINTACQGSIVEIYVSPSEYVVKKPDPGSDIGAVYFEIPVDKISKDLVIRTQTRFIRYQQRFVIDSAQIQAYDKESDLYKEYTKPSAHTALTQEIVDKAKSVAGSETNPYLVAKLFNDHIIKNIPYSFPDYNTADSSGAPLSTYVQQHQFGDCGYQSAYFTALCRSVGIPARTCGGFQLFTGRPASHFWAEFYLPEPYNRWIPVDVTASEFYTQVVNYPHEDLDAFRDYFFSQQDPFRMVVQNDIDLALPPAPEAGAYFFKACLQEPVALFYGSDKIVFEFSTDRHFYCNGTYSFNYDKAIKVPAGAEIQVGAAEFGIGSFDEKSKFMLKDKYLGKDVVTKLKIKELNAENTLATLLLPSKLEKIAYRLFCAAPKTDEVPSSRWVWIVE